MIDSRSLLRLVSNQNTVADLPATASFLVNEEDLLV
jgi:hypothetical protein